MRPVKNVGNFGKGQADEITIPANARPIAKPRNKTAQNKAAPTVKPANTTDSQADSLLATRQDSSPDSHPVVKQPSQPSAMNQDNQGTSQVNELGGQQTKIQAPIPESHKSNKLPLYPHRYIPEIRKTARRKGPSVVYLRLSADQKKALAKLVSEYNDIEDVNTSETEIAKIGLAALMLDYKTHKTRSFLEKVLKSMYEWD